MSDAPAIVDLTSGVRFAVRVVPRASRSEITGLHGTALKVRLAAPPVDGEANEELVRVLARALGVAKGAVHIVAGASGRSKKVEVAGIDAATAQRALRDRA